MLCMLVKEKPFNCDTWWSRWLTWNDLVCKCFHIHAKDKPFAHEVVEKTILEWKILLQMFLKLCRRSNHAKEKSFSCDSLRWRGHFWNDHVCRYFCIHARSKPFTCDIQCWSITVLEWSIIQMILHSWCWKTFHMWWMIVKKTFFEGSIMQMFSHSCNSEAFQL